MKKNYLLLLCPLFMFLLGTKNVYTQTSIPGGNVSGTWNFAGSPYLIQGSILIPNDSTLTIEPGVTVNFQGTYKLYVQGRIIAIGTITDTIIFTAANTINGWRGIRFDNTPVTNDTSKLSYCKLQYGKATGASPDDMGGAFYFYNFSKVIISNCLISNCTANARGGGISCEYSSPTISNNTISNNMANYNGGGIYCRNISNPTISNNTISNNTANYGGGIYCINSNNPTISNNTISNNMANYNGGGIICGDYSSPTITNNTISNNTAYYYGGGISCEYGSNPTITNNTIANNNAVNGGALYCTNNSDPTLRNTILWGNTVSTSGAQVYLNDETSDPNFYYCDVHGGLATFELNGNFYTGIYQNNIDSDPLFVVPSGGSGTGYNGVTANWSLQSGSPCINAGDPSGTYPATDIAGNPRIIGGIIDIGAYEYQGPVNITESVSQTEFIVYPNPATDKLNIVFLETFISGTKVQLFDNIGQKVAEYNFTNKINEIDLKHFAEGMYYFNIITEKGSIVKQFVINKK